MTVYENNKSRTNHSFHSRLVVVALTIFSPAASWAQSVPANLLDLSIEELFAANISESTVSSNQLGTADSSRWRLQYQYQRSDFENYADGTGSRSNSEVMFTPGTEARTADNFPIVPTTITQQVHAFIVGYELQQEITISLAIPFIKQTTDHMSIIPGYKAFTIRSEGIGDISAVGTYKLRRLTGSNWQFSIGASFPTGSIDEEGDTPRATGNQQLPYTMQLGSGTYDFPLSVAHTQFEESYSWGAEFSAKIRTGRNDRDYRLGDRIMLSSWLRLNTSTWITPSITLSYEYTDHIHGMDKELLIPGPFPYPAPVTNPKLFGGEKITATLGFRIPVMKGGKSLDLEIGKPIYQNLNGPQTEEDVRFGFKFNFDI